MAVAAGEVAALVNQLGLARAAVDTLSEPDRSLGLASLRLESTRLFKHLRTTGSVDPTSLVPLQQYVENLTGGELAEQVVQKAEQAAIKSGQTIATQALNMALTHNAPILITGLISLVLGYAGLAEDLGKSLATAVVTGVISAGVLWRLVSSVSQPAATMAQGTWSWAESIGAQADRVLADARASATRLWASAGGSAAPAGADLPAKARRLATGAIVACWIVFGIGAISFGSGFLRGLNP